MTLSMLGNRHPATAPPTASVQAVSQIMHDRDVGSVVVVEGRNPTGIVTDRDIVLRLVRQGRDPAKTSVREVMSHPLVCGHDDLDCLEAATRMREHHLRRLPIVDGAGALVGIVTFDDLVHHVGRESQELSEIISAFPVPHTSG
jgi:CBS domain-containing protein